MGGGSTTVLVVIFVGIVAEEIESDTVYYLGGGKLKRFRNYVF